MRASRYHADLLSEHIYTSILKSTLYDFECRFCCTDGCIRPAAP